MIWTLIFLVLQAGGAPPATVDVPAPPAARGGWGPDGRLTKPYLKSGGITADDYPKGARRREETGTVHVTYFIAVDGRALDCRVERSSGFPLLDEATCRIVESRYLMEPARDAEGRAIAMRVHQFVQWELA